MFWRGKKPQYPSNKKIRRESQSLPDRETSALLYPGVIGWLRQSLEITAAIEREAKPRCISENENAVAWRREGPGPQGICFPSVSHHACSLAWHSNI